MIQPKALPFWRALRLWPLPLLSFVLLLSLPTRAQAPAALDNPHMSGCPRLADGAWTFSEANCAAATFPGAVLARAYRTGHGGDGVTRALLSPALQHGGMVLIDPTDTTEHFGYINNGFQAHGVHLPPLTQLQEYNNGAHLEVFHDWLSNGFLDTAGHSTACLLDALPEDPGGLNNRGDGNALNRTCVHQLFRDFVPGWNFGAGSTASNNSYNSVGSLLSYYSSASATHTARGVEGWITADGDINLDSIYFGVKPAWLDRAGEGVRLQQYNLYEIAAMTGRVSNNGGGRGATTLHLDCRTNCPFLGIHSPLLDLTAEAQTHCNATVVTGHVSIATIATDCSLPVSRRAKVAAAANVIRPGYAAQTAGNDEPGVVTHFQLKGDAAREGDLVDFHGDAFHEIARLLSADAPAGGVQNVSARLRYSHSAGADVCLGGAVGQVVEFLQTTSGGHRYVQNMLCGLPGNRALVGYGLPGGFNSQVSNGPIALYHAADIVAVVNPSTGEPDGTWVALADNDAAWASGDAVENPGNIAASYALQKTLVTVDNPFAVWVQHEEAFAGLGIGGLGSNPQSYATYRKVFNTNSPALYSNNGGRFAEPNGSLTFGPWGNGQFWQYAPGGGDLPSFAGDPCLLCVESLAPGSRKTFFDWFAFADGSRLRYDVRSGTLDWNHTLRVATVSTPVLTTGDSGNTDTAGIVTLPAGSTTSAHIDFRAPHGVPGVCQFFTQNATAAQTAALGAIAAQVSARSAWAAVLNAPAVALTLGYHCIFHN